MAQIRVALHLGAGPDATEITLTADTSAEFEALLTLTEEHLDRLGVLHAAAASFATAPAGATAPAAQPAAPAAPAGKVFPDPILRDGHLPLPACDGVDGQHPECDHGPRRFVSGHKNGAPKPYAMYTCTNEGDGGTCRFEYNWPGKG